MFLSKISKFSKFSTQTQKLSTLPKPSAFTKLQSDIANEIQQLHDDGTYKHERVIVSRQGSHINVQLPDGTIRKELNFCANNYLGFSGRQDLIDAQKQIADSHGAGVSSVRFICGTQDIHKNLEKQIAEFHGREDAIIYPSCFDANAGLFEIVMSKEDCIITDSLNHASIIDGIRLCKSQKKIYKHLDLEDLEIKLKDAATCRRRMVVTDGVFSMDGDVAPLKEISILCEKYDAMLMIDECHATGFLGKNGRGTEELLDCEGASTIINSTMGKALGGAAGGYTTGPKEIIELLRNRSRPYSFSNSLPPAVVAACSKAFDIVKSEGKELSADLAKKTALFRNEMESRGFTLSGHGHPIAPVMIYDSHKAQAMGKLMADQGIFVIPFSFPVVARGRERIRVQISTDHSEADIMRTVNAFEKAGKELGVI